MGFFSKKEYEVIELPFKLDNTFDDLQNETEEALFIDLVFYGTYREKSMNFNVTFQYYNEDNYYEMINYLKQYENKIQIKVKVNLKKIRDFRVDLEDMADKLFNPEICKFERICWGVFDCEEMQTQ